MNTGKNHGGDLCKSHSARSEKDFCRVCPSNLNKKELENVYFTLLENNLDLKTTINNQREKIKILSTKVQRLTALQKTYSGKELKEFSGSKGIIIEQKECISELRRTNQCLLERIRQLNMRLCSVKQFLKRSPYQSTSPCNRCSNKNVSLSALITKRSETNLGTTAASSQCLVKEIVSSRTADKDNTSHEKGVQYDCEENKCRNHIEELMKKNDDLHDELLRIKEERATGVSQMERELCALRAENVRVRSDRTLAEERLGQLRTQLAEATVRLGGADLRCDELRVQLAVEQRKVAELDTQLRAADMSRRIAHAIEAHLTNIKLAKDRIPVLGDVEANHKPAADDSKFLSIPSPPYRPKAAVRTKIPHSVQTDEVFRSSDDSGYTEVNRSQEGDDSKASTYINQVLLEKIADLQNQVNKLKSFNNTFENPNESLNIIRGVNTEQTEILTTQPDKQIDDYVISESSESVITKKKSTTNTIVTRKIKSDEAEDNLCENETVDRVNKPAEMHVDYERNQIEKQNSDINIDIKLRKSFERFKSRSKDKSIDTNKSVDRKFSLQGSTDFVRERNIIKTGSIDDNSINKIDSPNGDTTTIDPNKNQTSKANDDTAGNAEAFPSDQYTWERKVQQIDKETHPRNEVIVRNAEKITHHIEHGKRKDSSSSKGTYSIHRDDSLLKLKTEPKDPSRLKNGGDKINPIATSYTGTYTLAGDVKKVLKSATSRDKVHRRKSAASEPRTYVKAARDASPQSTECEISSMSDLPSERDERSECSRSPGEERPPTATTTFTTTDYGSLSEGELPYLRDTTILSDGEKRLPSRMRKSYSIPVQGAILAAAARSLVQPEAD